MEPRDNETTYQNVTLDDFCRLCLQQCGARCMRPLRGRSVNFGTDKVSIPEMLVYVCGLPSHLSDELPQRVCKTCIARLESAYLICRDFKEKETILDRFFLNGFVLQRLVQYEKFRFDSDENENEAALENSTPSNYKTESNENDAMQVTDFYSMNVSQSGMEEEECPNSQMVQPEIEEPTADCSDRYQSKQSTIESFPQNSIVSLDTDYDSGDSGGFSTESPRNYKQQTTRKRSVATSVIPLNPERDGFFHCVHCPRRFSQRKHYMEHLSGHRALMEQRYKCPNTECGKCFRKKDQLNRHMVNCRR